MTLTAAGLLAMWHRLADILVPWYEHGHQSLDTLTAALATYRKTGNLPPLPHNITPDK